MIYCKDNGKAWAEIAFPSSQTSQYEVSSLKSGTLYHFYIKAVTKRGSSDPSDVLSIRTDGESNRLSNEVVLQAPQQSVPPYLRSSVIIPITVAVVIIVIACSIAYAYIHFEETNTKIIKPNISGSPSKNFQYINTLSVPHTTARQSVVSEEGILSFRYSDSSDKTKPLLSRPPMPNALRTLQQDQSLEDRDYATLPSQKLTNSKFGSTAQPLPTPVLQILESRAHIHDEKELLCHTPPHTTSSTVFCKVDIHNQDSSDSYDEFLQAHHV